MGTGVLPTYEHDVFLSYNHVDHDWVHELAVRIESEQWDGRPLKVFFDEWDIQPGDNIPVALEKALVTSRKIGLVLSPHALQSAWVELERTVTMVLDPANRQRRIIPLFLRGTDRDIPPLVAPLKYIDFRQGPACFAERLQDLICALREEALPRGSPNATPRPQVGALKPAAKEAILGTANYRCSICHTQFDVDVWPIDASTKPAPENLIALCPVCFMRASQDGTTPAQMQAAKKAWCAVSEASMPPTAVSEMIERMYREALSLSISQDAWDVKRAIIRCRQILQFNPFHEDAHLLIDRLSPVEKALDQAAAARDVRFHSEAGRDVRPISHAAWTMPVLLVLYVGLMLFVFKVNYKIAVAIVGALCLLVIAAVQRWRLYWLFVFLYPAQMIHESGHITAMYRLRPVRNAFGKKMPLWKYFHYIELNIDDTTVVDDHSVPLRWSLFEGVRQIRIHGKIPTPCVNWSRMEREWYGAID